MSYARSRISLASLLMAVILWWLPLPASAAWTFIDVEVYLAGSPDLGSLDPITVAVVGIQACDPTAGGATGTCTATYDQQLGGDADPTGAGIEFFVQMLGSFTLPSEIASGAFLGGLYFGSPTGLNESDFFITSATPQQIDGFDADGGVNAGYDWAWSVDFIEAPPEDRVLDGQIVKWFIEGDTLTVDDFLDPAAKQGKSGTNLYPLVMAHIQLGGDCSLKYVGTTASDTSTVSSQASAEGFEGLCGNVPEPSSVGLLGIALFGLAGLAAWRRRKPLAQV